MPWGVAAAAVGSVVSGALQSGAVGSGASQAQGISQAAINQADQLRQQNSSAFQPFVDQGTTAVSSLGNLLGINGSDAASSAMSNFTASPGYQYQLQQGLRAVDAGAAAQGMARSGATLKAEQTLGNNLADQSYGQYIGQLQGLAGLGVTSAQGQAGTTQTFDQLLNPQTTNQASTAYGAGVNQASIFGNTAGTLTNAIGKSSLFSGTSTGAFDGAGGAAALGGF